MRKLIFLVLIALAMCADAADRIARNGADELRISDGPCTNSAVLAAVETRFHYRLHAATARVGGQDFRPCWIDRGDFALLLYEDGDQGIVKMTEFTPVPEG